ncbi:hypothetical protein P5F71_07840 [Clostridium perfringens]|nr:hypothetical protein [Clostridium perfringens]
MSNYIQRKMVVMNLYNNPHKLTKDIILNSLDSFIKKPVVFNKDGKFQDYNDEIKVGIFMYQNAIGFIKSIEIEKDEIVATIIYFNSSIKNKEINLKKKYDNWQITINSDLNNFVFDYVEIF